MRNILITGGILLIVVCICIGLIALAGTGIFMLKAQPTSLAVATEMLPTPLPTLPSENHLSPELAQQMDLIQSQVIAIRGLEPSNTVPRTLLTDDQLRQNVINDFLNEYTPEEAAQDARILAALGLLPDDFDLIDFYTELYSEQVAGYYDDEAKAMYVVQGSDFRGTEKLTYAHEYVHVLQDQVYDFKGRLGYTDEMCQEDSERCAGIQSLIEGDASLTELLWFQSYASQQDYKDILAYYDGFESPVYDLAPSYMKVDFMFPYEKGQAFVQTLYDQGGFSSVDAAFLKPPASTEQILHPDKYLVDLPTPVPLPDLTQVLGEGWVEVDRNVMGEWYTYLILAHSHEPAFRLEEDVALNAAAGWGGDTYLVYMHEDSNQVIFIMRSTWDDTRDLDEFYEAFLQYGLKRWGEAFEDDLLSNAWQGEGFYSSFFIQDTFSTWILTPDIQFDRQIKQALP